MSELGCLEGRKVHSMKSAVLCQLNQILLGESLGEKLVIQRMRDHKFIYGPICGLPLQDKSFPSATYARWPKTISCSLMIGSI